MTAAGRAGVEVRAATAADVEAVAALEAVAFPTPWRAEELRAELAEGRTRLTVAVLDGRVVGHLLAWVVAGEAEILSVAADPAVRRRGVGRALVADLLSWAAGAGVARVHLDVRRDNAPARALYAAHGFVQVGVRRGYYADGAVDGLLMSRDVPAVSAPA